MGLALTVSNLFGNLFRRRDRFEYVDEFQDVSEKLDDEVYDSFVEQAEFAISPKDFGQAQEIPEPENNNVVVNSAPQPEFRYGADSDSRIPVSQVTIEEIGLLKEGTHFFNVSALPIGSFTVIGYWDLIKELTASHDEETNAPSIDAFMGDSQTKRDPSIYYQGYLYESTVEVAPDEDYTHLLEFKSRGYDGKRKFRKSHFDSESGFNSFVNRILRVYIDSDESLEGISQLISSDFYMSVSRQNISKIVKNVLCEFMDSDENIHHVRKNDRQKVKKAYWDWLRKNDMTYMRTVVHGFNSPDDPEIKSFKAVPGFTPEWKPLKKVYGYHGGTYMFTGELGEVYIAHADFASAISSSVNSYIRESYDFATHVQEYSFDFKRVETKIKRAFRKLTSEKDTVELERILASSRSKIDFFKNAYGSIHDEYQLLLKQFQDDWKLQSEVSSIIWNMNQYIETVFKGNSVEKLKNKYLDRINSFLDNEKIDSNIQNFVKNHINDIEALIAGLESNTIDIQSRFDQYILDLSRQGLISDQDKNSIVSTLSENGWENYSLFVPFAHTGVAHFLSENVAEKLEKSMNSGNVVTYGEFGDVLHRAYPASAKEIMSVIDSEIQDLSRIPGKYMSKMVAFALANGKPGVIKIGGPEMYEGHKFLKMSSRHPSLNRLFASPNTPLTMREGCFVDIRDYAPFLSSAYDETSLLVGLDTRNDAILHRVAVAAKVHTWGAEMYDDIEAQLGIYSYRQAGQHKEDILSSSVSANVNGRQLDEVAKIYPLAQQLLDEKDEGVIALLRDLRGDNFDWISGRVVDAGNITASKNPELEISRIVLDGYAHGLINGNHINTVVLDYYMAWYNVLRSKEESKKLGQNEVTYKDHISQQDMDAALIVDGFQTTANNARDRSGNGVTQKLLNNTYETSRRFTQTRYDLPQSKLPLLARDKNSSTFYVPGKTVVNLQDKTQLLRV
jgi:hypothetical protein